MASKRNVLSSLAVYTGDSEPEPESDGETGDDKGGLVSRSYGEDDVSRVEEDGSIREDDENSPQSEDGDSETEKQDAGDTKELPEADKRDPQELVGKCLIRTESPIHPLVCWYVTGITQY
ncbi:SAP30-binding protein [Ascaphus truei]|uniref:SAP30-binding protein n=1 Tax=Ascaphus truei TaxID=8439 RepID=UPI003F5937DE